MLYHKNTSLNIKTARKVTSTRRRTVMNVGVLELTKLKLLDALRGDYFCADDLLDLEFSVDSVDKYGALLEIVGLLNDDFIIINPAWFHDSIDLFLASVRAILARHTYVVDYFDLELNEDELLDLFPFRYVQIRIKSS